MSAIQQILAKKIVAVVRLDEHTRAVEVWRGCSRLVTSPY